MPELFDFEGTWRVSRQIADAISGQDGQFDGDALFERDAHGLRYSERGVLTLGGVSMEAERAYLWRSGSKGIEVYFDDGRFFHRIGAAGDAAHWCDPDQYDVVYDFGDWPHWSSEWRVKGPRKDYVMITGYQRSA